MAEKKKMSTWVNRKAWLKKMADKKKGAKKKAY